MGIERSIKSSSVIGLDTNIFIYADKQNDPRHEIAKKLLEKIRQVEPKIFISIKMVKNNRNLNEYMNENKKIQQAKTISIKEGSAASLMEGFGTRYITPYALYLGASNTQIGLLSSFPGLLGSLAQIPALFLPCTPHANTLLYPHRSTDTACPAQLFLDFFAGRYQAADTVRKKRPGTGVAELISGIHHTVSE